MLPPRRPTISRSRRPVRCGKCPIRSICVARRSSLPMRIALSRWQIHLRSNSAAYPRPTVPKGSNTGSPMLRAGQSRARHDSIRRRWAAGISASIYPRGRSRASRIFTTKPPDARSASRSATTASSTTRTGNPSTPQHPRYSTESVVCDLIGHCSSWIPTEICTPRCSAGDRTGSNIPVFSPGGVGRGRRRDPSRAWPTSMAQRCQRSLPARTALHDAGGATLTRTRRRCRSGSIADHRAGVTPSGTGDGIRSTATTSECGGCIGAPGAIMRGVRPPG